MGRFRLIAIPAQPNRLVPAHVTIGADCVIGLNPLAPLLEQERGASRRALVAQTADPIGVHRARVRAALAADYHPIDLAHYRYVFGVILSV